MPKQQRPKLIERRLWIRQEGMPIGFLVWWSLGRDLSIDHAQLRHLPWFQNHPQRGRDQLICCSGGLLAALHLSLVT